MLALFFSARQAQALAQRQLEFVTGITHELHTPLAAIASAAENLSDGVVRDQDQIRRYGRMLKGESGRLRNMVGQVLDLASTARAPESMQPRALNVVTVLESVLEEHDWTLSEGAFTIEKNFEEGLPAALVDPDAFHRALHNVVGNAIKYGGRREKWVGLKVDREAAGREGRLCIRVQDRGPGIPRTEQRRIFDPFYRGTAVAAGHIHGTGLGLAVARRLLEANGGSLELELSERGRGSTFVVRVPQAPDTVPQEEKIEDEASSV